MEVGESHFSKSSSSWILPIALRASAKYLIPYGIILMPEIHVLSMVLATAQLSPRRYTEEHHEEDGYGTEGITGQKVRARQHHREDGDERGHHWDYAARGDGQALRVP